MAMHRELSAAAEHIEEACGQLDRRYHEPEAIALIRALGHCDKLVGAALPLESTKEQQAVRRELHLQCTHLATAIRHAIAYPSVTRHQHEVVKRARELRRTLQAFRETLPTGRTRPANDDGREQPSALQYRHK